MGCIVVVGGISDRNHAQTVRAGFFYGHFHGAFCDDHAHAVMSVDYGRCLSVAYDFEFSFRILDAAFDNTIVVNGLQPADTV